MEEIITIELFGQQFTFKAEKEDQNANEVADYLVQEVDRIRKQLSDKKTNADKFAMLIMAALNITNENVKLKNNYSELLRKIAERSTSLLNTIDCGIL